MMKAKIVRVLHEVRERLEECAADATDGLTGYSDEAIDLAWEAVSLAIDLVNTAEERVDGIG